jgi:hypothetical protein
MLRRVDYKISARKTYTFRLDGKRYQIGHKIITGKKL